MQTILYPRKRLASFAAQHRQKIILGLALFLVALLSFGLGYLMATENEHAPIIIEKYSIQ